MVDVAAKDVTRRVARAGGRIVMQPATLALIRAGSAKKGDVLGVARIAAIQAAKRTSELIPLCHPLALTRVAVAFDHDAAASAIAIEVTAETLGQTGVEMEALTAAAVGLLTVYDMCKAVDRGMRIEGVRLLEKSGGKSGHFKAGRERPRACCHPRGRSAPRWPDGGRGARAAPAAVSRAHGRTGCAPARRLQQRVDQVVDAERGATAVDRGASRVERVEEFDENAPMRVVREGHRVGPAAARRFLADRLAPAVVMIERRACRASARRWPWSPRDRSAPESRDRRPSSRRARPARRRRSASAAATESSVSMTCTADVAANAVTSATRGVSERKRSSVWIACVSSTPPPSRASVPRPGSS